MPRKRKQETKPDEQAASSADTHEVRAAESLTPTDFDAPPLMPAAVIEEYRPDADSGHRSSPPAGGDAAQAAARDVPTDSAMVAPTEPRMGETADPATTASADSPTSAPRGRFRSWVVDETRGYQRLTDETSHRLVLLFRDKPADDILSALKGAAFRYEPEYAGLRQAWVRRNDFEGRLQVEAIEKLIGTIPTREVAER
jgi:hypothetical protein